MESIEVPRQGNNFSISLVVSGFNDLLRARFDALFTQKKYRTSDLAGASGLLIANFIVAAGRKSDLDRLQVPQMFQDMVTAERVALIKKGIGLVTEGKSQKEIATYLAVNDMAVMDWIYDTACAVCDEALAASSERFKRTRGAGYKAALLEPLGQMPSVQAARRRQEASMRRCESLGARRPGVRSRR